MTEIPKAAIEAAAKELVTFWLGGFENQETHKLTGNWLHPPLTPNRRALEAAEAALQAAAPHWYDPNEFAYGAGFRDGIGAAAELVRKRLGDLDHYPSDPELGEEVATDILALTPQAKP